MNDQTNSDRLIRIENKLDWLCSLIDRKLTDKQKEEHDG